MTPTKDLREEVARLIDPWPFGIVSNIAHTERAAHDRAKALAKADSILALIGQSDEGWRGIESAPRDGTHIWLGASGSMRIGWWATGQRFEHRGSIGGGWRDFARAEYGGLSDLLFAPTHWRPLPAAPKPLGGV